MFWVHCNKCYLQLADAKNGKSFFDLTSCGQIYCKSCYKYTLKDEKCAKCHQSCGTINLSQMDENTNQYFEDIRETMADISNKFNKVNQVLSFQESQQSNIIKHFGKMRTKFFALNSACKNEKKLREMEKNEYKKKLEESDRKFKDLTAQYNALKNGNRTANGANYPTATNRPANFPATNHVGNFSAKNIPSTPVQPFNMGFMRNLNHNNNSSVGSVASPNSILSSQSYVPRMTRANGPIKMFLPSTPAQSQIRTPTYSTRNQGSNPMGRGPMSNYSSTSTIRSSSRARVSPYVVTPASGASSTASLFSRCRLAENLGKK